MPKENLQPEEIQDFSKPLTAEDVDAQMRLYMERMTTNSVKIAGTIRALNESKPKQKFDKQTKEPILDEFGNPTFWDAFYFATLSFEGGEVDVHVKEDWYNNLTIGRRVLFEGAKGLKFGKVQDIFHTYTILA